MKSLDLSALVISSVKNIYRTSIKEEHETSAVASSCLLIVKSKGQSIYTIGNKKYTADSEHVIFIPKGSSYSLYVGKAGACTVIEFDALDTKELSAFSFYVGNESGIASTVKNLYHYWTLKGPAYRSKCLSELYGLFTEISSIQTFSESLAGKYGLIHRSVKYIETNYRKQDLYTPMLAEMSGIGETYYRSIFIAVFGVAPTRYIQQYRVEKAKELIAGSEGSIEEIAVAVGFANSSYFCKVFKSVTGLTPSEFADSGRLVG